LKVNVNLQERVHESGLRLRVNLRAFLHKFLRLGFHPLLQRLFLGDALFGGVFATSSVIFIEQKCGRIVR
jgi:hypothetical protein